MCLATPLQIKSIKKNTATVEHDGKDFQVSLQLVPKAKVGDWILAHGNLAINTLSGKEAKDILRLISQLSSPTPRR
jgi:hydrogenase expression/formation protein HypC